MAGRLKAHSDATAQQENLRYFTIHSSEVLCQAKRAFDTKLQAQSSNPYIFRLFGRYLLRCNMLERNFLERSAVLAGEQRANG